MKTDKKFEFPAPRPWRLGDETTHPNFVEFRLGYSHDALRMAFLCSACFITDELHHPEWGELATIH